MNMTASGCRRLTSALRALVILCCLLTLCKAKIYENSTFDKVYNATTPEDGSLEIYKYKVPEDAVIRIHLASKKANASRPLFAVFREPRNILSMQLPMLIQQNHFYSSAARTLCPFDNETGLTLSVELSSAEVVDYSLNATRIDDAHFELRLEKPLTVNVTPSEPYFLKFDIPDDLDSVMVNVESPDDLCMTLSVQPVSCPVYDLENNVVTTGFHQTMTTSGSVAVRRNQSPFKDRNLEPITDKFYLILLTKPNDDACIEEAMVKKKGKKDPPKPADRRKNVTVLVKPLPTDMKYILPIAVTFGAILVIYVLAILFIVTMGRYERECWEKEGTKACKLVEEVIDDLVPGDDLFDENERVEADRPGTSKTNSKTNARPKKNNQGNNSNDENNHFNRLASEDADFDRLEDAETDKDVVRHKAHLTVADMSMKTWKERDRKYTRYTWGLVTIALFYGLPVVQLVFTWQNTVRLSGDMDLCWYNFHCARPFLGIFAFNSIFSNVGYVALGIVLIILVKEREYRHRSTMKKVSPNVKVEFGLPQHNGLMYAIGTSIMMEGVLSASYHVCPSSANYQFDTAFMYMIGALGILKIYQLRHPDINPNAHVSFGVMAMFIFIAMMGVYFSDVPFWSVFAIMYVVVMVYVSFEFYFKGRWRCNVKDVYHSARYSMAAQKSWTCCVPMHKSRFAFLAAGNLINFAYVIFGFMKQPKDFPSYLLFPFTANLSLYIIYYMVMKIVHGESIRRRAIGFLLLSGICWGGAAWFFLHPVTDWSVVAAQSRIMNRDCILMDFYDGHDIWHFASAMALFLSFAVLICIDDDLQWVPRNKIPVF